MPFLERADEFNKKELFINEYKNLLLQHYPKRKNGKTIFTFNRYFITAVKKNNSQIVYIINAVDL